MTDKDKKDMNEAAATATPVTSKEVSTKEDAALAVADMYKDTVNAGTEDMTQADYNTPILKIIQSNTQNITNKKEGWFYRSDTNEQLETVKVNLVNVSTKEAENYNRTGMETVKVYFGFYAGTNEPFKMFVRGWSLGGHRAFQTELVRLKKNFGVPMFALTVELKTDVVSGTIEESKKSYTTNKLVMEIVKDKDGAPVVEMDADRIGFLFEACERFKSMAETTTVNDKEQNEQ